ncbi:DUF4249 family protein [Tunicatimonas pelagia]|uniref:DUF4249 family protein n=1 Tax=Tunicatimonas pelagia TaxID=931531 RepID=UPI002664FA7F|nr:DUF4249 family protein [Tunicatimonas pelagia]WKN43385.1 DUF4249 family protein [Tunicatimonas pelagia]
MIAKKYAIGLILLTIFSACEEVPEFQIGESAPVVQAYLYAGEPIDDVRLTELVPFVSDVEEVPVITNAEIIIISEGNRYSLSPASELEGTYRYEGDDLAITSGNTYGLEFTYQGELATAETTVPFPPEETQISQPEISVPQILTRRDLLQIRDSFSETIDVTWDNNEGEYYYVLIENLEESPEAIDVNNSLPRQFSFVSEPTQENIFPLRLFVHYQQYGLHRVRLFRVNEEYANLYESLEQDSRNLNEPFSNVRNGLGIFTGFAYDAVYFEVKKR